MPNVGWSRVYDGWCLLAIVLQVIAFFEKYVFKDCVQYNINTVCWTYSPHLSHSTPLPLALFVSLESHLYFHVIYTYMSLCDCKESRNHKWQKTCFLSMVISSCIHCPANDRNVPFFIVVKNPIMCVHTTFSLPIVLLLDTWIGSVTAIVNKQHCRKHGHAGVSVKCWHGVFFVNIQAWPLGFKAAEWSSGW